MFWSVLRRGNYSAERNPCQASGNSPASTCSVPCMCSVISRAAASGSCAPHGGHQPPVLLVGGAEDLGRMGDVRDQQDHLSLGFGHRRNQPRAAGSLGEPDVETRVGLAVAGEVLEHRFDRVDDLGERLDRRRRRALGGEHRDPDLDRHPLIARVAPSAQHLERRRLRRRERLGDERPAAAPPHRAQIAALPERDERLAQGRPRNPELLAQLALRRQSRPGRQQPETDRRPQPLDRLLERGHRPDWREHRVERRRRLEWRHRAWLTDARTPAAAPSR